MSPHASRRSFIRHVATTFAAGAVLRPCDARPAARTTTRVFHDPVCATHDTGRDHWEAPGRLQAVMSALRPLADDGLIALVRGVPATDASLLLVHDPAYIELVKREVAAGEAQLSTGDTAISAGSYQAATAAVGAVTGAVDSVLRGECRNAFCAVRPPGHHASQRRGMGFCLFNSIAIGARHAQRQHGVSRVLIADWDVHHGNGTQNVFWEDGSVLFFDTHQDPWYPGTGAIDETGAGKGAGLIINRPFPAGAGRREILGAFRDVLVPAAERFRPELVMISAGFDSRQGDPLGRFTLDDEDFADLTALMLEIADRHAGGRLVSVLEGGYRLEGLASATAAHVGRLAVAG